MEAIKIPFKSEAQRKFMWAKHPGIARRWAHEKGTKNKGLPKHKRSRKHKQKGNKLKLLIGLTAGALAVSSAAFAAEYATVTGYTQFSAPANQVDYWCDEGTKIEEPGGSAYVLTDDYDLVVVKAGAGQYANTEFGSNPSTGQTVWADTNGNGIYDPGGQNGDKDISHVILCVAQPPVEPTEPPVTPTEPPTTPTEPPVTPEKPTTPEKPVTPDKPTVPTEPTTELAYTGLPAGLLVVAGFAAIGAGGWLYRKNRNE